MSALTHLELPLTKVASGKVRELFDIGNDRLLLVASDRISAYDVVMDQGIPYKGEVLTKMSLFWFDLLASVCPTHFITSTFDDLGLGDTGRGLEGRAMIVKKLEMLPVEFVIRGYLAGSGWKDYQSTGAVCGIPLPAGLEQSDKLPEAIFTPASKAASGHDLNISEDEAAELCGPDLLKTARGYALSLYEKAAVHAADRGIILADTKFEFGVFEGDVVLGDEVLTPDSSRLWPAEEWTPGTNPPSFDKQYLRDWLDAAGWDHSPPPPALPEDVVAQTSSRYVEAYERITGSRFEEV